MTMLFLLSCGNNATTEKSQHPTTRPANSNKLSMKINGVLWEAENEIFGAFHPKGYNKAILISGNKGAKGKEEQLFNLNLYNAEGPGTFHLKTGNADYHVVQLANFSPEHYLYGSLMGFDLKVTVTKASANPTIVEAVFEGTLSGNSGDTITITEGKFSYSGE